MTNAQPSNAHVPELLDLLQIRLVQIGVVIPPDAPPEEVVRIVAEEVAFVPTRQHLANANQLTLIDNYLDSQGVPRAQSKQPNPTVWRFIHYVESLKATA